LTGERVERRLAAILAADVVGYSRLVSADEADALTRLGALRRDIIEPNIASHSGRLFKIMGDGFLAEFASAVQAVSCALAIQTETEAAASSFDDAQKMRLRIGIHVGDVMVEGEDLMGDGINIAARLESIAAPGGVSISRAVHDQVRDRIKITFDDKGEVALKNIARPVQVFAVAGAKGAVPVSATPSALALPDKPSIAVLPFQNMSGDPEQEYFADGIVEDIITALSRFPSLFVIARNSCFVYKGKAVDVRQVGRELGVRYVLEGSVRKAGGRIRITAQLIEAHSNKHLWAEKLDGELNDLFELQDKLTTKIVSSVSLKLEIAEFERVKAKATIDLGAYDLYQKATALVRYHRRFDEATELYRKAFALDPTYAVAYAMAASTLFNRQFVLGTPMPAETRDEIIRLAETAITLPREDALAMARAAHLLCYLGRQYDVGKELADAAIELNPNLGAAWIARGWVSVMRAESQQAIDSFSAVLRLDPLDPARPAAWSGLGCAYNIIGEYEKGYEWSRKALEAFPAIHAFAYFVINAVPYGRLAEARDTVAKMLQTDPRMTVSEALVLCHTRDVEWQERMRQAFRKAGLPDGPQLNLETRS
jgi:adenylate cyclase